MSFLRKKGLFETGRVLFLPITALVPNPNQPRRHFSREGLEELASSISQHGILQPLSVRRSGERYVANKLRLLKLSPQALTILRQAGLTERHARALLRLDAPILQEKAAQAAAEGGFTVAKTESYVASLLAPPPAKAVKPTFLIKDVRLFLNTIKHALDLMQSSGIQAACQRQDTEGEITLTIHIPR